MSLSTKRSTSSSAHRIITAGVAQLTSQYCGYYSKVIQSRKDYRQLDGAQMWGYLTQEAMNRTEHVELLHPPHYTSVSTLMPTWESMLHNLPSNCVCHYIELMMFTRHLHHYQWNVCKWMTLYTRNISMNETQTQPAGRQLWEIVRKRSVLCRWLLDGSKSITDICERLVQPSPDWRKLQNVGFVQVSWSLSTN